MAVTVNLEKVAKEKGLKYFLISFVDLFGVLRSKLVPVRAIKGMQKKWCWFCRFCSLAGFDPG